MIAYDSPEGATLRALTPSRSALTAILCTALGEDQRSWVDWAAQELSGRLSEAEAVALRFIQALSDGDTTRARQYWAVLGSFPAKARSSRLVETAHTLRASLPV